MAIADSINRFQRRVPTWPFYAIFGVIPLWWLYLGLTGGLGVEPIEALEHRLGELGLQVLIASLCVTPLRTFAGINLIRFRRMLGLVTFYYISLHLLVWLVLDVQILSQIWADILKRPYITVGMAAFVLMIPLAITSNAISIRKLGPKRWRLLHRLVYLSAILGALHFVLLVKGWQIEPLLYLGAILFLLTLRLPMPRALART
ncbi:protein-methionine-sulfoxide reductase heme-binding subunit MsrQ [Oceaniglobus trochenteri]|uniref:protein-methionine-sulfoxide reductase heme-binding subunit MsrQ n=1 Tax=Oceaniglobus trochenteri TaxID=2763260 RepID=UPI001CFFACAC|nr:protein-methionine-sulfoxide reductase heme-binding subunit MsrQ [Oceaniglobus trochenteri]